MQLTDLTDKLKKIGLSPEMGLNGLMNLKPINYWEYVNVDTLLTLQKPRTAFPDEYIFIVYHQITELVFNLMLQELKQIVSSDANNEILEEKLPRLTNYSKMLISSFDVMTHGMDYDQYNTFRHSLSPASGFQSAQYRKIEIYCTDLVNLSKKSSKSDPIKDKFSKIYWQSAGTDHHTGEKTLTMRQFEEKYLDDFIETAEALENNTLEAKLNQLKNNNTLSANALRLAREFDAMYNIEWPLVHLNTAEFYLNLKGAKKEATGGSDWQKYLHPKYQKRTFFPDLWSAEEMAKWGE